MQSGADVVVGEVMAKFLFAHHNCGGRSSPYSNRFLQGSEPNFSGVSYFRASLIAEVRFWHCSGLS